MGKLVLDLVITSDPDMVDEVSVADALGSSDHMIHWVTKMQQSTTTTRPDIRDYKRANFDGMRSRLRGMEWDSLLVGGVEECWGEFKKCLLDAENDFVPTRSSGVGKYKKAIWM